jgi:putative endonuclease
MAGEAVAAAYLELVGCEVVARNRRMSGVEVDLVVSEGPTRVLVEVKFRGRADYGGAAMAVDRVKRERLLKAARALSAERDGPVRIDVVAVELSGDGMVLHHYRNAVTE